MLGGLTGRLIRHIQGWDRPSQVALGLGLAGLLATVLAAALGPESARTPAVIGAAGALVVTQVIFLWGNRGLVTDFAQAQGHFQAGEFAQARPILEQMRAEGKADARVLTLLGNTYRQLGLLDEGAAALEAALELEPGRHYPLYSLGRLYLAGGYYAEAVTTLRQALEAGASPIVRSDLGEALYRQGAADEAAAVLNEALGSLVAEPYRLLMARYILHQLGQGEAPARELIEAGLPYWEASVEPLQEMAYGQALLADVEALRGTIR